MGLFETFDKVSHQDWLDKITIDLKGKDFEETLVWKTNEGIDVQPFYNSCPENFVKTPLKVSKEWKIRETVVINSIETANQKALLALKGGADSILFVGSISSQAEMDHLLKDIQTNIIEIHFYNAAPSLTASFVSLNQGSISYDFLIDGLDEDSIIQLAERASNDSSVKTITVTSDSNPSVIEEVATLLSKGVEYLNILTDKGVAADLIAKQMQFNLSIGTNYFFEIAKIRAARLLWNTILEQYNVSDSEMYIYSETSISQESKEDENFEILRNTTRAMSAIIAGCDSLSINPHDNSEKNFDFSNRIARNIQHILKEEAFFSKVNNPADGAYYIETLTDEIATKAWKRFQEKELTGGYLA